MASLIKELRSHGTSLYRPDHPTSLLLWKAAEALTTMQAREATLIRAMDSAFDFLGGVDGAARIRDEILEALGTSGLVE